MYDITVILCSYRRNTFRTQLEAIRNQTVLPTRVIVWRNDSHSDEMFNDVEYVKASRNMGVWPRFTICRDIPSDFYYVVDDDTIPGSNYLEHCIKSYEEEPKVLCANGFVFKGIDRFTERNFHNREQVGWVNPKKVEIPVDWPGHSWFFDQTVLHKSFSILRSPEVTSGEDAHLAFSAQQVGQQCKTTSYPSDKRFWGSINGRVGDDRNATHRTAGQKQRMIDSLNHYRDLGWVFIND